MMVISFSTIPASIQQSTKYGRKTLLWVFLVISLMIKTTFSPGFSSFGKGVPAAGMLILSLTAVCTSSKTGITAGARIWTSEKESGILTVLSDVP
jgi:hypothetical protein